MSDFERGDAVRLGETAIEKHTVLFVWGDGVVQIKQWSTGKVRNVRVERCVLVAKGSDQATASPCSCIWDCRHEWCGCPHHSNQQIMKG